MAAGGSKQCDNGIGCPGDPLERGGRLREREKWCCPEREKELFTPIIMAPRAGKDAGVRGGPDDAVGESLAHGD